MTTTALAELDTPWKAKEEPWERPGGPGAAQPARRCRVLIVEDELIISWQLEIQLAEMGYDVAGTAINGAEAMQLAADAEPDAILLDVRLGKHEDGVEIARQILARRPVPIIFCTAFASEPSIAARIRALGAPLLTKPVDPVQLRALLRQAFS